MRVSRKTSWRWNIETCRLTSPPSLSSTLQIKERRTWGRIRERVHVLVRTEWLWREVCTWLLLFFFFFSPYNVTIGPFFPLWFSSVFLSKHPEFVWSGAGADSLNRVWIFRKMSFSRARVHQPCAALVCVCVRCILLADFYECVCVCMSALHSPCISLTHIPLPVPHTEWGAEAVEGKEGENIKQRGKTLPVSHPSLPKCKFIDLMKLDAAFVWWLFCRRRSRLWVYSRLIRWLC